MYAFLQGDSGGPYYSFESDSGQQRAILVAVISRGQGCADRNSPGIGGRVKAHTKRHFQPIKIFI